MWRCRWGILGGIALALGVGLILVGICGIWLFLYLYLTRPAGDDGEKQNTEASTGYHGDSKSPRRKRRKTQEGVRLQFTYVDAYGQETVRQVLAHHFERAGTMLYINAYCYLRQEERQFRADRMTDIIDIDTGEVIEDLNTLVARSR